MKYGAAREKADKIAGHYGLAAHQVDDIRFLPGRLALPVIKRRLTAFCRAICQAEHKERFVIKEPAHHEVADKIVSMFGAESLLLLTRGPLATATSLAKSFQDPHPLRTWAAAHAKILELSQLGIPLIRSEDLVDQPEDQTRRACTVLGMPFEPEMLNFGAHNHTDDRLALWNKDKSGTELVTASQSPLHQTVAKGYIDCNHNSQRLRELPAELLEAFRNNAHGAKELAAEFGYDELSALEAAHAMQPATA